MKRPYRQTSGTFRGSDGTKLFHQSWIPEDAVSGWNLVFHHGFGEHCDRYANLVEAFEGTGVSLYSYDARGHGRSEGQRGHTKAFSDYVRDLEEFLLLLREAENVRHPVLFGHSMGGLVVLAFGLSFSNQFDVSAIATSGAALRVAMNPALKVKTLMGRLLSSVAPNLTMPAGVDVSLLSHDPVVCDAYKTDPLVHGLVSVSMGMGLLAAGEEAVRNADRIRVPLFMGHGENDGIASPHGTVDFFRRAGSVDKRLRLYKGLYHEIMNETPRLRQEVLEDYREWILSHMPPRVEKDVEEGQGAKTELAGATSAS